MKRTFAVALLLLSFASAALADGSGGRPPDPPKASKPLITADGGGGRPPDPPKASKQPIAGVVA